MFPLLTPTLPVSVSQARPVFPKPSPVFAGRFSPEGDRFETGSVSVVLNPHFTPQEAEQLARAVEDSDQIPHAEDHNGLVTAIVSGKTIRTKNHGVYLYGMVRDRGDGGVEVVTTDAEFGKIMGDVLSRPALAHLRLPAGRREIAVALKVSDYESTVMLMDFMANDVQPFYHVKGSIPAELSGRGRFRRKDKKNADKKPLAVEEVITWPFFETLLSTDRDLPPKARHLEEKLLSMPVYNLVCPDSPRLEEAFDEAFAPLRKNMAALMAMEAYYVNSVDLQELITILSIVCPLGMATETALDNLVHGGLLVDLGRSATVGILDGVDNMGGAWGMIRKNAMATGQKVDRDSIYDRDSAKDIAENHFRWDGPVGPHLKEGRHQALRAAATGTAMAYPLNRFVLADGGHGAMPDAMAGGAISIGTALTIPFMVRNKKKSTYVAVQKLIDDEKIAVPPGINRNQYAAMVAEQDLCSQIEFASCIKSFPLVPFVSGGILGAEGLFNLLGMHIPHEVFMTIYMGGASGMENILMVANIKKALLQFPAKAAEVSRMILEAPEKGFDRKRLRDLFANRLTRRMGTAITAGVKLPSDQELACFEVAADELPTGPLEN